MLNLSLARFKSKVGFRGEGAGETLSHGMSSVTGASQVSLDCTELKGNPEKFKMIHRNIQNPTSIASLKS